MMSHVHVEVHLELDKFEPDFSEAVRISRAGRADVMLARKDRHPGVWDSDAAGQAATTLARKFGLDNSEATAAVATEVAWADETSDPRWRLSPPRRSAPRSLR